MQNKSTSSGCNGARQGSTCVIWTGQPIPALGIEKGDSITDILCTIATQIVDLTSPLDLSTISIQCLKDQLNIDEPVERTIANMLQIAYDSSCDLKTLIDAINARLSNQGATLVLNLGCLTTFDVYGNPLPYNEQSVLQTLINTACGQQTTITAISGTLGAMQADIDALEAIPQYTEPLLSSCLFTSRKTSDALVITASALCTYIADVGQVTDIQSALSQMPTGFTTAYGLTSGWIVNPSNLAQSYSNALLVISDLYNRISNIENTCCKANCDSITVDFDVKLSDDRTSATLFFATKSNVPAGFTEVNPLGSKLIITDSAGNEYDTYIKVIPQLTNPDGIVVDLTNSPIDPSLDYTFGMSVTLTNSTLTCVKCISHSLTFKDTCAFCQITVTSTSSGISTSDKIVIVYKSSGTAALQYITIYAGQTQAITKTAQVSSVIVYGNAQYTSTCTLPTPATTSCYEMTWAISLSSGGHDAVFTDSFMHYISIFGVQYPLNCPTNDSNCLKAAFASFYPAVVGLISTPAFTSQGFPQFNSYRITFATTADIAANMLGYIGNTNAPASGDSGQGTFDGFAGGAFVPVIPSNASNCPSNTVGGGGGAL